MGAVIVRKKSRFLCQDAQNDVKRPENLFRINVRCVCARVCVRVCVCMLVPNNQRMSLIRKEENVI